MKKAGLILLLFITIASFSKGQKVALKTNLLYDATSTVNLGCEVGLGKYFTLDLSGNYNGWSFSEGKSIKHWMVQPEFRYWIHERFNGHFFGVHGFYGKMDTAGLPFMFSLSRNYCYDGNFCGAGISYGYQLYLSTHWNIEFTAGVGYSTLKYDKSDYPRTDTNLLGRFRTDYWGLTKAGISIIYIIK